jgi:hypothetical protein
MDVEVTATEVDATGAVVAVESGVDPVVAGDVASGVGDDEQLENMTTKITTMTRRT